MTDKPSTPRRNGAERIVLDLEAEQRWFEEEAGLAPWQTDADAWREARDEADRGWTG